MVPAAGPCRGRGAGLGPRCTRSGPGHGLVPGGSLRRWSWAVCAVVVCVCASGHSRVLFPVPSVFLLGTRPVPCADTAPVGPEDPTPGSRAYVRVCAPLGRVKQAGHQGTFWCAPPCPVAGLCALFVCPAPSWLRLPLLWWLLFLFPFFFLICAPGVTGVLCFLAWDALGLGVLCSSPFLLFFPPAPALPLSPFFLSPALLLFFFPACVGFFFLFSSVASCRAVLVVRCWGGLRVLGCGICCRRCAVSVLPRWGHIGAWSVLFGAPRLCLFSVCCCPSCCVFLVARTDGGSLPRASRSLLLCFLLWSRSALLAACRCPWVLLCGCPVAPGLVVMSHLVLVCVVLVSLVWCFVGCRVVLPPPPPECCPLFFSFSCRVCVDCAPPPPAVCGAPCFAVPGVLSCGAVVCGVVYFAFSLVLCVVLLLHGVLAPCCWVLWCAGSCCAVFGVLRSPVLLRSLLFYFCGVGPWRSVVLRAVSVCVVLCRGATCCSAWPCRGVFLC